MVKLSRNGISCWVCLFLASLLFGGAVESKPLASRAFNLMKGGLALEGYDPVSYFQAEGPAKGDPELSLEVEGVRYLFLTEENRRAFAAEPAKYRPAFGGWCAWAMLDGDKVEVDPLSYRIFDGKLLLFYDGFWGDTRSKWEEKSAKESESALYGKSEKQWQDILLDAKGN